MTNFGLGVVIGKFYPPHRGHKSLIDTACSRCNRVIVIVCERPADTIPGRLRQAWLQETHPTAEVMLIDDRYDENDSRIWAENTVRWIGRAPDVVFTSECYGDRYSELMGAKHICVDQARTAVPISATAIRSDPFGNWNYLEPPVRAWFTKRICVLGAESTGTTTLAKALSETLQTTWVEEFGREYSEIKLARKDSIWRTEEFSMIAREQQRREDAAARHANRVLICDTNAFATTLWHRRYMGSDCADVAQIAKQARCDLYLLTGDEIPFVQDGLRDGEHLRRQMHTWFEDALAQQPVPWRLVRGSHKHRLQSAVQYIQDLFRESAWKPHPQTKALA